MMKFLLMLITLLAVALVCACERQPQENRNQGMEAVNRNTSTLADAPTPPPDAPAAAGNEEAPPVGLQPPATNSAPPSAMNPPSFWNPTTGEIKDLPSYPGGSRMNVQYGPLNGMDTGFIMLTTMDSMEKIAAYYDKAIKAQGWTVANKMADQEMYKVQLKKDANNEAIVQVEKQPQTKQLRIVLTRLQKSKQAADQSKQPAEQPKIPNP
jgi:hypothetical protein